METSRALVAAVPDQEVIWISFMRPVLKDLRLSVEVAPVSTRKRISADPMRTFTIGSLSHRSIGISSEDTDFCAECAGTAITSTNAAATLLIGIGMAPSGM